MSLQKVVSTYDEKACWEQYMVVWRGAATYRKLRDWHRDEYGFGSQMGAYWAAWRWACKNPEACYPQYKNWFDDKFSQDVTFNDFVKLCKTRVENSGHSILGKRKYGAFCRQWDLAE